MSPPVHGRSVPDPDRRTCRRQQRTRSVSAARSRTLLMNLGSVGICPGIAAPRDPPFALFLWSTYFKMGNSKKIAHGIGKHPIGKHSSIAQIPKLWERLTRRRQNGWQVTVPQIYCAVVVKSCSKILSLCGACARRPGKDAQDVAVIVLQSVRAARLRLTAAETHKLKREFFFYYPGGRC